MKHLNVYRIERAYGGPEEGGWWYDDYIPLKSFRGRTKRIRKKLRKRLESLFPNPNSAGRILAGRPEDLNSVDDFHPDDTFGITFGHDIMILEERGKAHYKPRPYYC